MSKVNTQNSKVSVSEAITAAATAQFMKLVKDKIEWLGTGSYMAHLAQNISDLNDMVAAAKILNVEVAAILRPVPETVFDDLASTLSAFKELKMKDESLVLVYETLKPYGFSPDIFAAKK